MFRAGSYGLVFVAVAAALVVSCGQDKGQRTNTSGSVNIVFNCGGNNVTLRLDGDNGGPAWKAERRQGEAIGWKVQQHVTINSIKLKNGDPIPVNVAHNPSGPGTPLDGTVQGTPGTYNYNIDATCRQSGDSVRLIIDPEMIVR